MLQRYGRLIITANVKKEYDDCIRRATSAIADTEEEDIMEKCQNLHMRLLMVENYAVLNYCGFSKIIKKHDKFTKFKTREKFAKSE